MNEKKLTDEEIVNVLDCWLNPNNNVECKDCPFGNMEPGQCREATLKAAIERIREGSQK